MYDDIHNSVVRDCILGNRLIETPRYVRTVIDTPEFQRLRNIRQTGLASYVFPTAEHSRFAHSIGVYGTAREFFRHLQGHSLGLDIQIPMLRFDESNERDFYVAALVHDVGHTAFSHVLETILLPLDFLSHEDCTRALVGGNTDIARAIDSVADRAAVVQMLNNQHPNKALNDLISSTFDVDRCDYVLRDSTMTGVEYGKYDLSWLIHALSVELNENRHPVLVLDGPRGLDALRQFLTGRRYLHRHVYYHPVVRGAQLLLKAIFERIQDTAGHADHIRLAPQCLQGLMNGERPTLDEFIRTTDVEIVYMIRAFSELHGDPVVKFLCDLFTRREFPKAIIDSARESADLEQRYNIELRKSFASDPQFSLPLETALGRTHVTIEEFVEDIITFTEREVLTTDVPQDAVRYLVSFDRLTFSSTPPPEMLFRYEGEVFSPETVQHEAAGTDLARLLETFSLTRFYAPKFAAKAVVDHIRDRYSLRASRSRA